MVKDAKPYSTMTLYQDNPNITGGPLHIVKKDIVCGSLHVLIANKYEKEYLSEDGKENLITDMMIVTEHKYMLGGMLIMINQKPPIRKDAV